MAFGLRQQREMTKKLASPSSSTASEADKAVAALLVTKKSRVSGDVLEDQQTESFRSAS